MITYLHIPKTAGTAIKNLKVDNPSLPLVPATTHSISIKNAQTVAFGVRDPLLRFCSGYWERVTQDKRKLLNSQAPIRYRRSGYKQLENWEVNLFKLYKTPDELLTAFRTNTFTYKFILEQKTPLRDLLRPYITWLGKLEDYKEFEHKVRYAFDVNNLSSIFLRLFKLELPEDPFLKRSRQQFNIDQSYYISEENRHWFQNNFRKDDYELLEYIKQQKYYVV